MKERIYLFDNLKFFLIISVVVGHFIDYMRESSHIMSGLFLFIYSFHMPLFIYLAGLFHSNQHIKSRCISLIAIGFYMKILFTICRIIFRHQASFSLLSDPGVPWFTFVIAMFTALSYFLRNFDTAKIFILSFLLACVAGYDDSLGNFLYLSRFITFYPFYLLGQMTNKKQLVAITRRPAAKILGCLCLSAWAYLCIFHDVRINFLDVLFTGKNAFSSNAIFAVYGPFYRVLCMIITFLIGLSLISLFPDRKLPFISQAGSRTLQVFFWHYPFIYYFTSLNMDQILSGSATGKVIWCLIAVLLTVLLSTRYFAFPVKNIQKSYSEIQ